MSSRIHQAAVLHGAKDLRLEPRPLLPPQPGYAQIAVVSTGLCGSDHHYYSHGRNGDFVLRAPLVLGHEAGGIVTALGAGVTGLRVGQRVAIEPGISCSTPSKCSYCDQGRYNLCSNMRFCSSAKTYPHLDGTLQGYMNHPAQKLFPIPDACTFDHAALAEPLSVVLHAAHRADFAPGQRVLVIGSGAIGLLACALAKAKGAGRVCAIDINQRRLDLATQRGFADAVLCMPRSEPAPTPEEGLRRVSRGVPTLLSELGVPEGFDVVYECSGAESCIQLGVYAARPGGKLVLVGMGTSTLTMPLGQAATREVDILGVFRYHDTWPEALALLASGKLAGVESIITHRLPLNKAKTAFELLGRGVDERGALVVKVVVSSQTPMTAGPPGDDVPTQLALPLSARHALASMRME